MLAYCPVKHYQSPRTCHFIHVFTHTQRCFQEGSLSPLTQIRLHHYGVRLRPAPFPAIPQPRGNYIEVKGSLVQTPPPPIPNLLSPTIKKPNLHGPFPSDMCAGRRGDGDPAICTQETAHASRFFSAINFYQPCGACPLSAQRERRRRRRRSAAVIAPRSLAWQSGQGMDGEARQSLA